MNGVSSSVKVSAPYTVDGVGEVVDVTFSLPSSKASWTTTVPKNLEEETVREANQIVQTMTGYFVLPNVLF